MAATAQRDEVNKLREMIEDIKIAMLTTVHADGRLRSRPMMALEMDKDGALWFFTNRIGDKSEAIAEHSEVNLSYSNPDKQKFVSVTGDASLVDDRVKIKELWSPFALAWFPQGVDDPNLALLKVEIAGAQYWDVKSSTLVEIIGYVKAALTGESYGKSIGEELIATSKKISKDQIRQQSH